MGIQVETPASDEKKAPANIRWQATYMLMSSILEVKRKELQDVPQNQLKSSLSLHWKSLRMESAEHMRRLLMMLLPNHSDRFLQSIYPKMQKLSPTNGRAIYLLWTNTKLSSGNLKMASHSHKCTYTLWTSRGGSEEYTIIAPRSDFKGILMSIIFGLTDETIWIQSLMCLCGGWWITNQYALTQTINVGASSAYT